MVEKKLKEFNLAIRSDIIACVSDGASVLKKAVFLMGVEHHQCYAHALHLGILESIYKKDDSSNDINVYKTTKILFQVSEKEKTNTMKQMKILCPKKVV